MRPDIVKIIFTPSRGSSFEVLVAKKHGKRSTRIIGIETPHPECNFDFSATINKAIKKLYGKHFKIYAYSGPYCDIYIVARKDKILDENCSVYITD